MKNYLPTFLLALVCTAASAQQELMFYQMSDYWHANALNPAFFPQDRNVQVGLPGFSIDAWNSGDITFDDFLVRQDNGFKLDFSALIDELEPENDFVFDQRLETVSLGLRLPGNFYVSAAHAVRTHGVVVYPKGLPEILWEGNGTLIGQTVDIAPSTLGFGWQEFRLGLAKTFDRVTVGGRVNILSGVAALETDRGRRRATVYTDPDVYQLTLDADYGFWSSALVESIDTADLGFDFNLVDNVGGAKLFDNSGASFDVGAEVRLLDRLTISASVLDIGGRLNWKNDTYYFRTNGNYTYEGGIIDGKDLLSGSDSIDFATDLDTLNDIFAFSRDAQEFSSTLPTRFYAGVNYQLAEDWAVNATFFHQNSTLIDQTAVGVGLRWTPLQWLSVGAMYGYNSRSAANVGFHLGFKPGPVQLYFASDNLLTAFQPYASPQVNLRMGLSLAFGKRDLEGDAGVPFEER